MTLIIVSCYDPPGRKERADRSLTVVDGVLAEARLQYSSRQLNAGRVASSTRRALAMSSSVSFALHALGDGDARKDLGHQLAAR